MQLHRHRDGDAREKAAVEEMVARIIIAAAIGTPFAGWGQVADAIHLAYVFRLRSVAEDVRLCPATAGEAEIGEGMAYAKGTYMAWYESTQEPLSSAEGEENHLMPRNLRDISEHQGSVDLEYVQRKLSLAGDMAVAIRRFLDRVEEHRLQGQACPVCKTSRLRKLRKVMENYLNCEGYTR